jgi:hypothetical protein
MMARHLLRFSHALNAAGTRLTASLSPRLNLCDDNDDIGSHSSRGNFQLTVNFFLLLNIFIIIIIRVIAILLKLTFYLVTRSAFCVTRLRVSRSLNLW